MTRERAAHIVDCIAADVSERCGVDLEWLELGYDTYYALKERWIEILVRGALPPPKDRRQGCPVH